MVVQHRRDHSTPDQERRFHAAGGDQHHDSGVPRVLDGVRRPLMRRPGAGSPSTGATPVSMSAKPTPWPVSLRLRLLGSVVPQTSCAPTSLLVL